MTFGPCPTVKVKSDASPDGYIVINESDLTDQHELWDEKPRKPSFQPDRKGR